MYLKNKKKIYKNSVNKWSVMLFLFIGFLLLFIFTPNEKEIENFEGVRVLVFNKNFDIARFQSTPYHDTFQSLFFI